MATYSEEFIIRYAEDELDAAERLQFETDLKNDPSLQDRLSLYLELRSTLRQRLAPDDLAQPLHDTLSKLNKEYFKTDTPVKRISPVRWLTGIAAAALLIVAATLLWPSGDKALLNRLGSTQMIGTTDRGDNTDTLLQTAATYFNRQEFAKALPILDSAVSKDTTSQLALFYRGVAAWHTGAVDRARNDLERVYSGESVLRYEAAFYLALSYATRKDNSEARLWLDKIPNNAAIYSKAKELRASLK